MEENSLGAVMRRHREEKGLSLRQLEAASGVLLGQIGKIERGDVASPGVVPLAKMCVALDVSVDQVLEEARIIPPRGERAAAPDSPPATRADLLAVRAELQALGRKIDRLTRS